MPSPTLPRSETYQEWLVRTQEEALKNYYTDSLLNTKQKDYPTPVFSFETLYYPAKESKTLKDTLFQAGLAITRCDVTALKKILGPSLLPYQIEFNQAIHQRYWNWLNAHRDLLFYLRAEYLFWSYQKKYFLNQILKRKIIIYDGVPEKDPKTGKEKLKKGDISALGMSSIKKYQEVILPASYHQSVLDIDTYTQSLEAPENNIVKKYLDALITGFKPAIYRNQRFRKEASTATRHPLNAVMKTQLKVLPHKDNTLIFSDEEKDEASSDAGEHLYPAFLSEKFHQFLSVPDKKLYSQFIKHLDKRLESGIDIAVIGNEIRLQITAQFELCIEIVRQQGEALRELEEKESELLADFHDKSIIESGIDYSSLEGPYFYVADEEKKTSAPLLHLAMRVYTDAVDEQDVQNAFRCVELLISRGCSPYKRFSVNSVDGEILYNASAFEYAKSAPNAELLIVILRHTITYTPFTEKLRAELFEFANETLTAPNTWPARILNNKKSSEVALGYISLLITLLHTGEKYNDAQLLRTISQVKDINHSSLIHTKLQRLLTKILDEKDKNLICIPDNAAMEMELKPIGQRSRENSPETLPVRGLSSRNLFSKRNGYEEVKEDPDLDSDCERDFSPTPA